eukprot:848902-Pelagomonas_calceolata.AAC.4
MQARPAVPEGWKSQQDGKQQLRGGCALLLRSGCASMPSAAATRLCLHQTQLKDAVLMIKLRLSPGCKCA